MVSLSTGMAEQYGDGYRLAARARLFSHRAEEGEAWLPWVARHLPIGAGARLLDVGCGPGKIWDAVAPCLPGDVMLTLTDLSPGMVAAAQARCALHPFAAVQGQVASADALPFEDASFDGVVAMHMLYHLRDPESAVAEMQRVLRPGGFVAVTTNGVANLHQFYALGTVVGGMPQDPATLSFGFDEASRIMNRWFDRVAFHLSAGRLRITSREDVYLALTSFPPGDSADADRLAALRGAIDAAFEAAGGVLDVEKESGLFVAVRRGR